MWVSAAPASITAQIHKSFSVPMVKCAQTPPWYTDVYMTEGWTIGPDGQLLVVTF